MEQNTTVELRCSVMQVRFHRDNYSVCLCKTPDQIPEDAVRNTLELTGENTFIAVGYGLPTQVGKEVKVSGIWTFNKKYETTQLEVRDCADYVGGGNDAIVEYLSSGILKGVRKAMAEKIYATFGEDTLDVLENNPQFLLTVPGIREKKLEGIIASFVEHQDMHMLTRLLTPYGVPYRTIVRIRKAFGAGAAAIVKENPYSLCRVIGIGFVTADDIAMKMGMEPDSPNRITGAVVYTMKEAMSANGHIEFFADKRQYDIYEMAIAVYLTPEKRIGYVTRYKNETIARLMDIGRVFRAYVDVAPTEEQLAAMKPQTSTPTEDWNLPFAVYMEE